MNKKQKIMRSGGCLLVAAAIACYSLGGAAYAYKSNELRVTNTVYTGDIDIAISETQLADDGVTIEPFVNDQVVVPGDTVSKIVNVKNLAEDCYVRIKVGYNQPTAQSDNPVDSGSGSTDGSTNETTTENGTGSENTSDTKGDVSKQVIIQVMPGDYTVGQDIDAGTYTIVPGQNVTFTVITKSMNAEYVKTQTNAALSAYLADENVADENKQVVKDTVYDFYDELDLCVTEDEVKTITDRYISTLIPLLDKEYQAFLTDTEFVYSEVTEHTSAEETLTLYEGQIFSLKEGSVLEIVPVSTDTEINIKELNDLCLNGISEDWVKAADGYYYYKNIVPTGETIQFFNSVSFPTVWTEEFSDFTFGLDVLAEAVQSDNFTPAFDADHPWGDTEIELCIHENDGTVVSKDKTYTAMTVSLDAEAAQLITDANDFFQNFDTFMPGDTVTDTLNIKNNNEHSAEIFFHTETPDLTDAQKDLLKNLQLKISVNGTQVYEGDLESTSLNQKISLGTYAKDATGKIDFSIYMPAEDQNEYAVRDTKIIWVFDCGWDETNATDSFASPKTGINDNLIFNMVLAGTLFLIGGTILVIASKKQKECTERK